MTLSSASSGPPAEASPGRLPRWTRPCRVMKVAEMAFRHLEMVVALERIGECLDGQLLAHSVLNRSGRCYVRPAKPELSPRSSTPDQLDKLKVAARAEI